MQRSYLVVAAAVLLAAIPVAAHHSFSAEYDAGAPVTLTGVVSKIEWSNPHVYIYVGVKDEKGRDLEHGGSSAEHPDTRRIHATVSERG